MFRSTPLHEGRLVMPITSPARTRFRSTPLHEGRPRRRHGRIRSGKFRSTPLHEGRLVLADDAVPGFLVSITPPAWGRTGTEGPHVGLQFQNAHTLSRLRIKK